MPSPDLTVKLGSMVMKNPVMIASGIFGYGDEFRGLADYGELGALVLKTITRELVFRYNLPAHLATDLSSG